MNAQQIAYEEWYGAAMKKQAMKDRERHPRTNGAGRPRSHEALMRDVSVLKQALTKGPLTSHECLDIIGGDHGRLKRTIDRMRRSGVVVGAIKHEGKFKYAIGIKPVTKGAQKKLLEILRERPLKTSDLSMMFGSRRTAQAQISELRKKGYDIKAHQIGQQFKYVLREE